MIKSLIAIIKIAFFGFVIIPIITFCALCWAIWNSEEAWNHFYLVFVEKLVEEIDGSS